MQTQQRLQLHRRRDAETPMQRELTGKVAIVTGASMGIGAATARELARRGARLVLAARGADQLNEEASSIIASGGEAVAVPTDISRPDQVQRLVAETCQAFGKIDILINNAAIGWHKLLVHSSLEDIEQIVGINLTGAMLMTRAVLPVMLEQRRGAIINVSSVCGRVAVEPLYSATKYGLRGFSLSLRRQLADSNISVSLVSPAAINTRMSSDVNDSKTDPDVVANAIIKLIGRGRREVTVPRRHNLVIWLEQGLPSFADFAYHWRHRHGLGKKVQ